MEFQWSATIENPIGFGILEVLPFSTKRLVLQNDLEARYRNSVSQSARNMFVLDVLQLKTRPEVHTKPR